MPEFMGLGQVMDRRLTLTPFGDVFLVPAGRGVVAKCRGLIGSDGFSRSAARWHRAVSYTHLTLPTIYSV